MGPKDRKHLKKNHIRLAYQMRSNFNSVLSRLPLVPNHTLKRTSSTLNWTVPNCGPQRTVDAVSSENITPSYKDALVIS